MPSFNEHRRDIWATTDIGGGLFAILWVVCDKWPLCIILIYSVYIIIFKNIFTIIWQIRNLVVLLSLGEVAEWSIAAVLKTVELRGSGGSNPSLSAGWRSR